MCTMIYKKILGLVILDICLDHSYMTREIHVHLNKYKI